MLQCSSDLPSVGRSRNPSNLRTRWARLDLVHVRAVAARCYLVLIVEVIELTTMVAILNCGTRSLILWRRATQSKSVQTAQTSPLSSCVSSSRTGQSRPAFGFDVMIWVPIGGFPTPAVLRDGGGYRHPLPVSY